ncbi:MAG: hypothetical protein ABI741_13455 [Ferruginibacter sp.]
MQFFQRWIRISLFNLLLVSSIGVTLRYKIAFSLPFIDQKHLLHGHSHFAFAGWVTQALMVLLVAYLAGQAGTGILNRYKWLLLANLFTAYGMLVAFPIQGYGLYSIIFSTASVFVSYVFAVMYWKDINKLQSGNVSHLWFKAALLFNAISSLGAFALAGMMISRIIHQKWYLAAEYFYLHFQYNGWFYFACMGLFTARLINAGIPQRPLRYVFWLFASALIPAYLLSILWVDFRFGIYIIIVLAAFIQLLSWGWLLSILRKYAGMLKPSFSLTAKWLFYLAGIALSVKLLLQLGSVIPSLSDLSYGFRPIIIGYLHLVLLGIITLSIIGFMVADGHIIINKMTLAGIIVFTSGIIVNEILLMMQGVWALSYNNILYINEMLFITACVMFTGLILINLNRKNKFQT